MRYFRQIAATLFMLVLLWPAGARASEDHGVKTLSPYFFVKSDDPGVDPLPLQSTSIHASISGVIAEVVVTQLYQNEGAKPLEAVYVFPASTRAAVHGMKMLIGDRVITATIREREKARREYEQAKQNGRSASLLEQHRPNVFQMNVANILPGDEIQVELRYTELLVPVEGVYEFVYPTVVGPRYADGATPDNPQDHWIANPYLQQGELPKETLRIKVDLSSGVPLQDVSCPSHKVQVAYESPEVVSVDLDPSEGHGGNRDFILRYRLAGGQIETGMILWEGEKENFFLMMVQPPERVREQEMPPREYIFVVDVSGSMHGFPLDISKRLLKDLIGNLRPVDRFNVILFAGGSSLLSERSIPATPDNIRQAVAVIEKQRGGGGTELLPALKRALSLPSAEGTSRSLVVVTDGYVRVETEAFELIRNRLGSTNVFPFGIGSSVNRHLIEGMARAGMGEPFVITHPGEAAGKAKKFRELIESPVLTDIRVEYQDFQVYDVEPLNVPDVMAERPVIMFGKWRGKPQGHVRISGVSGTGRFKKEMDVAGFSSSPHHSSLRYLWARHRISLLSDYNHLSRDDNRVAEVKNLGLTYNLLTAYTSFVAVDERIRNLDGPPVRVEQPLPLPQGVSAHALGGAESGRAVPSMARGMCEAVGKVQDALSQEETEEQTIRITAVLVQGGVETGRIRRLLEANRTAMEACLRNWASGGKGNGINVVLLLTADHRGRIIHVLVQGDAAGQSLTECLRESVKDLRLPTTTDGTPVQIRVTLQVV